MRLARNDGLKKTPPLIRLTRYRLSSENSEDIDANFA